MMMIEFLIVTGLALGVMLGLFEWMKAIARLFAAKELADGEF